MTPGAAACLPPRSGAGQAAPLEGPLSQGFDIILKQS